MFLSSDDDGWIGDLHVKMVSGAETKSMNSLMKKVYIFKENVEKIERVSLLSKEGLDERRQSAFRKRTSTIS